jgi:hypothetical protein
MTSGGQTDTATTGTLRRVGDTALVTSDSREDIMIVAYKNEYGDINRQPVLDFTCERELDLSSPKTCGNQLQVDALIRYGCDNPPKAAEINAHWLLVDDSIPPRGQFFYVGGEEGGPIVPCPVVHTPPQAPPPDPCEELAQSFIGSGELVLLTEGQCFRARVAADYWIGQGLFDGEVQIFWRNGESTFVKERKPVDACGPVNDGIVWQSECVPCSHGHVNAGAQYFLRFVAADGAVIQTVELPGEGCTGA